MRFRRRPLLAGKNLSYLDYAQLHGSKRRHDAGGAWSYPYFEGLTDKTLSVNMNGTTVTVTFSSDYYHTALAELSAALAAGSGTAKDLDGSVLLRSNVRGADGFVEVVGGTATDLLGFSPNGYRTVSRGGELPAAPEGRRGNSFSSVFPGRGEDLTTSSVQRALGALSANLDYLYQRQDSNDLRLVKVTGTIQADRKTVRLPSWFRAYTGYSNDAPTLTRLSSKSELANFFFVLDTATKQPAASQVVGVVRGTPAGNPPFADTASWGAGDGGNVLGLSLCKLFEVPISAISNGCVAICEGQTFIDDGVEIGDYAFIHDATNNVPFSHNGWWVVEDILVPTTERPDLKPQLQLRPMSRAEQRQVGILTEGNEPLQQVLELNDNPTGDLGLIDIYSGPGCSGVSLVVDPPIPPDAPYEFYATMSVRGTEADLNTERKSEFPAYLSIGNTLDNLPNGLLSAPTITWDGSQFVVGTFYVRWHGRVIRIAGTRAPVFSPPGQASYELYWDEKDCLVKVSQYVEPEMIYGPELPNPTDSATTTRAHLIATLAGAGGTFTRRARVLGNAPASITVGWGGMFKTLNEATYYVNHMASYAGEVDSGIASGAYAHMEIVLLSDQVVTSTINISAPGVSIRGVNPTVRLIADATFSSGTMIGQGGINGLGTNVLTLKDLVLKNMKDHTLTFISNASVCLSLKNVTQECDSNTGSYPFKTIRTGAAADVTIQDCKLYYDRGISWGAVRRLHISNSVFSRPAETPVGSSQMISCLTTGPSSQSHSFGTASIVLKDVIIEGLVSSAASTPALIVDDSSTTASYRFTDCKFVAGATLPTTNTFIRFFSEGILRGCILKTTGAQPQVGVVAPNATVAECNLSVAPKRAAGGIRVAGVVANTLVNSTVTSGLVSTGVDSDVAVIVTNLAEGNQISVTGATAILCPTTSQVEAILQPYISSTRTRIRGNRIFAMTDSGLSTSPICVDVNGVEQVQVMGNDAYLFSSVAPIGINVSDSARAQVSENSVKFGVTDGMGFGISVNASDQALIAKNHIYRDRSASIGDYGVNVVASNGVRVTDNTVMGSTTGTYTGITLEQGDALIQGNVINAQHGISLSSLTRAEISDNQVLTGGILASGFTENTDVRIRGNTLLGTEGDGFGTKIILEDGVVGMTAHFTGNTSLEGVLIETGGDQLGNPTLHVCDNNIGGRLITDVGECTSFIAHNDVAGEANFGSSPRHTITGNNFQGPVSAAGGKHVGNTYGTVAGTGRAYLSGAEISDCTFNAQSATYIHSLYGCKISNCQVNSAAGAIVQMDSCLVSSTKFSNGLYIAGAGGGENLFVGCSFQDGAVDLASGSLAIDNSAFVNSTLAVAASGSNYTAISNSKFTKTSGTVLTCHQNAKLTGCEFASDILVDSKNIYAANCVLNGNATLGKFSGSPGTDVDIYLTGCRQSATKTLSVTGNFRIGDCTLYGSLLAPTGAVGNPLNVGQVEGTTIAGSVILGSMGKIHLDHSQLGSVTTLTGVSGTSTLAGITGCTFSGGTTTMTGFTSSVVASSDFGAGGSLSATGPDLTSSELKISNTTLGDLIARYARLTLEGSTFDDIESFGSGPTASSKIVAEGCRFSTFDDQCQSPAPSYLLQGCSGAFFRSISFGEKISQISNCRFVTEQGKTYRNGESPVAAIDVVSSVTQSSSMVQILKISDNTIVLPTTQLNGISCGIILRCGPANTPINVSVTGNTIHLGNSDLAGGYYGIYLPTSGGENGGNILISGNYLDGWKYNDAGVYHYLLYKGGNETWSTIHICGVGNWIRYRTGTQAAQAEAIGGSMNSDVKLAAFIGG